jgi:hypothetical protein
VTRRAIPRLGSSQGYININVYGVRQISPSFVGYINLRRLVAVSQFQNFRGTFQLAVAWRDGNNALVRMFQGLELTKLLSDVLKQLFPAVWIILVLLTSPRTLASFGDIFCTPLEYNRVKTLKLALWRCTCFSKPGFGPSLTFAGKRWDGRTVPQI